MGESQTRDERIADFYEERRGDVSGWRPVERKLSRGGATSVFSVRFTQEELEVIEAAAERDRKPISAFVREAAVTAARGRIRIESAFFGTVSIEEIDIRSVLSEAFGVGVAQGGMRDYVR